MKKRHIRKNLRRIEWYIDRFPDAEIWVLANKKESAKIYWEYLSKVISTNNIKPFLITSRIGMVDGLDPSNALILACGKWWDNPNAKVFMDIYFDKARVVIPVDELPDITI